jgi:hypothetical protein
LNNPVPIFCCHQFWQSYVVDQSSKVEFSVLALSTQAGNAVTVTTPSGNTFMRQGAAFDTTVPEALPHDAVQNGMAS